MFLLLSYYRSKLCPHIVVEAGYLWRFTYSTKGSVWCVSIWWVGVPCQWGVCQVWTAWTWKIVDDVFGECHEMRTLNIYSADWRLHFYKKFQRGNVCVFPDHSIEINRSNMYTIGIWYMLRHLCRNCMVVYCISTCTTSVYWSCSISGHGEMYSMFP